MKLVKQVAIIMAISLIAEGMERLIPIPIAASVYGLILMFFGLVTGLIPLKSVERVADFLVEMMPIMFMPGIVRLMTSVDALQAMLVPMVVISVVSTILVMGATGRTAQFMVRHKYKKEGKLQTADTDKEEKVYE